VGKQRGPEIAIAIGQRGVEVDPVVAVAEDVVPVEQIPADDDIHRHVVGEGGFENIDRVLNGRVEGRRRRGHVGIDIVGDVDLHR
jgi:hypothetical protein